MAAPDGADGSPLVDIRGMQKVDLDELAERPELDSSVDRQSSRELEIPELNLSAIRDIIQNPGNTRYERAMQVAKMLGIEDSVEIQDPDSNSPHRNIDLPQLLEAEYERRKTALVRLPEQSLEPDTIVHYRDIYKTFNRGFLGLWHGEMSLDYLERKIHSISLDIREIIGKYRLGKVIDSDLEIQLWKPEARSVRFAHARKISKSKYPSEVNFSFGTDSNIVRARFRYHGKAVQYSTISGPVGHAYGLDVQVKFNSNSGSDSNIYQLLEKAVKKRRFLLDRPSSIDW